MFKRYLDFWEFGDLQVSMATDFANSTILEVHGTAYFTKEDNNIAVVACVAGFDEERATVIFNFGKYFEIIGNHIFRRFNLKLSIKKCTQC